MGNYGSPRKLMIVTGNCGYDITVMSVTGNYGYSFEAMKVTGNYGHDATAMIVTGDYGYDYQVMFVSCFPKSELVHTASNERTPIGALRIGDRVCSWDAERKKANYTEVTRVHENVVNEVMCFNNVMRVSLNHPMMVMERSETGIFNAKWKASHDVSVGDYLVGADGRSIAVKSKKSQWFNDGIEVVNLSTADGLPFVVGNYVVRADNYIADGIAWADAPMSQKIAKAG